MFFVPASVLAVLLFPPSPVFAARHLKMWFNPRRSAVDGGMLAALAIAALESGASVPRALRAVHMSLPDGGGKKGRTLREVSNSLLLGAQWEEAWEDIPAEFLILKNALAPAWEDGAAPVPLLERSIKAFRLMHGRRLKTAAADLGAKLAVPLVACFLPAFLCVGVIPVIASSAGKIF